MSVRITDLLTVSRRSKRNRQKRCYWESRSHALPYFL